LIYLRLINPNTVGNDQYLINDNAHNNTRGISEDAVDIPSNKLVLKSVTYPDGSIKSYNYDENGHIIDVIRPDGEIAIKNEYDENSRTIRQSFPDGGVMTYEYSDNGKEKTDEAYEFYTTATEQNGNKVVYISDNLHRHIGTRYIDGEERYTYNKKNQKVTVTDKNGNITRYTYDNKGKITGITDAVGNRTNITYNSLGKIYSIKKPNGTAFFYDYDKKGNLKKVTDPDGKEKHYKRKL